MLARLSLSLVILAAASAPAVADDAATRAQALAEEAQTLAQAGDFLGAAARYKAALALDDRPEYLCNVGIAYWKARDLPRAQLFLGVCSARASHLAESFVASIREVLTTVETRLRDGDFAPVSVIVDPETAQVEVSSFAPDDTFVGSRIVWLPLGTHTLTARSPGHEPDTQDVTITTRDAIEVRLSPPSTPPPPPKVIHDPAPPPETVVVKPPPSALPGYVGAGVTAVAIVTDLFLYASASDAATHAGELPPGMDYDNAASLAHARVGQLYAMYAVTGACAAVTGYLFWRARPSARRRLTVSAGAGEHGASVWLFGRF